MKWLFIAILFVAAVHADFNESEEEFEEEFHVLPDEHEKEIEAEELEKAEDEINAQNEKFDNGESTFSEKLYPDSDLTKEEFEKEKEGAIMPDEVRFIGDRIKGVRMPPESVRNNPENAAKLRAMYDEIAQNRATAPSSYDAKSAGLVTTAKNQKSCGSCAAFAASGLHETCMLKAGAKMSGLDLSEQHLVDCGYDGDSMNACNGAYAHSYPEWFHKNGGVGVHEADYPYLDRNPKKYCPSEAKKYWNSGAKVSDVTYDYGCNAQKMKDAVATYGAVAVALYASDSSFGNYASGVYQGCTSTGINHAVLVVGYGTEYGVDYWLVKNSWGSNWGDQGFIKIRRGNNECGIEGICVVAKCAASGGGSDVAPSPPPPAPVIPTNLYCDISRLFGSSYITGSYTLRVYSSTGLLVSEVTCKNSVCTPKNPGPSNACVYICGKTTC